LKILIYGLTDTYGGVEAYVIDRLPALLCNHQIDFVFSSLKDIKYKNKIPSSVSIKRIAKLSSPIHFVKSLHDIIKSGNYDAVYCNVPFANALLYLTVKLSGCRLIVHSHNTKIEETSKKRKYALTIYHYISKILFSGLIDERYGCSLRACKWLFNPYKAYSVKRNAIDCKKYEYDTVIRNKVRKKLNINPGTFVIGHVGRFSYQKNHQFLIKIFNEIIKKHSNSILLLVGDGEYRLDIEKKCIELGIRKKVKFLGIRNDVNELMQAMDCFLLPSRFEGLPIVGVEAQAAGLPCFFSDSITSEVKITSDVYFFSLQDYPAEIALRILWTKNMNRKNTFHILSDAGYNLLTEIKHIKRCGS